MIRLVLYAIIGAFVGGIVIYLLAESLPEGAIAGMVLGGSLGVLVAMRKGAGASSASFEYEAAGIHDNNLTTIARRNLVREEYRASFESDAGETQMRFREEEQSAGRGES